MYLTDEPIQINQFISTGIDPSCGASAFFAGCVRNHHEGRPVLRMEYEAYRPMAERQIASIADDAKRMFGVHTVRVLHRIGKMNVGDVAVVIEVWAAHRAESFDACRYVIDAIKVRVPIWKHEFYADGSNQWVLCQHNPGAQNG